MKHTVELKFPKLFGKKSVGETEVKNEINLEHKEKEILIGVLLTGFVVGYLIGHYRGVNKTPPNVMVFK